MAGNWSLWVVIGICVAAGYGVTSRLIDAWRGRDTSRDLQTSPPAAPDAEFDSSAPGEAGAEDCFAVLGLTPLAEESAVRAAYRRLVSQYHPDKVAGLGPELIEVAERETRRINAAYEEALRRVRAPGAPLGG